jgi:hypothetical protein
MQNLQQKRHPVPTQEKDPRSWRDRGLLTRDQRTAFVKAAKKLNADLKAGQGCRKGLRIKDGQGHRGVFEMTWADDGRATFRSGTRPHAGDVHVICQPIASQEMLTNP